MVATGQLWFLQRMRVEPLQSAIPVLAGCVMLGASFLPWLIDPLGQVYGAWNIAIDVGWQVHSGLLNYGVMCACCAAYAFLVAYAQWRPFRGGSYFVRRRTLAGVLCLLPLILFLFQYLLTDTSAISTLAQHKIQALLMQQHYGYSVSPQRIKLSPYFLDSTTLPGRLQLLIDQIAPGCVLPCISAWMLIEREKIRVLLPRPRQMPVNPRQARRVLRVRALIALLAVLIFGRTLLASLCEQEAKALLAAGDYTQALGWLDAAHTLNPALEQVIAYHIERGQALYFLDTAQDSDDSRAYLASAYMGQKDYLDAYQQMLVVWQHNRGVPWVTAQTSMTLERLAETTLSFSAPSAKQVHADNAALAWLLLLKQVDAANVYAPYMLGRVQCDLHNYRVCAAEMVRVVQLSSDKDIQSSAYTYMALSEAGQGQYTLSRMLLAKAIMLDPNYRNNTARENMSGLR